MGWLSVNQYFLGSILILFAALYFGPLPIVIRGVIRRAFGQGYVQKWQASACCGLSIGMVLFVISVGLQENGAPLYAVLACLLVMLALIDWQWRWLPIEWTLSVIALALLHSFDASTFPEVLLQILVPSGVVLSLRFVISAAVKREALGLGDVWLIAGLGGFLSISATFLLIGLAAVSGLLEALVRRNGRKSTIVSYGTHLCFVFLILISLPRSILT